MEFLETETVCDPVATVRAYLRLTESLRVGLKLTYLFVNTRAPHKSVTSSTLGHWIKAQLRDAGTDTGNFSDHSTRGAAAPFK